MIHRERVRHQGKSSEGLTTAVPQRPSRGYVNLLVFYSATITTAQVFFALLFLSYRYNEQLPVGEGHSFQMTVLKLLQWDDARVISTLVAAVVFFLAFLVVELKLAVEPMLAPFLLKQKIPVLVGISNLLVAFCNFSIMYFFPMWFQTVMLSSASTAGEHNGMVYILISL